MAHMYIILELGKVVKLMKIDYFYVLVPTILVGVVIIAFIVLFYQVYKDMDELFVQYNNLYVDYEELSYKTTKILENIDLEELAAIRSGAKSDVLIAPNDDSINVEW